MALRIDAHAKNEARALLGLKMKDELTEYQRGNRDGLVSFARWAFEMYKMQRGAAERLEFKACENRTLARDNVRTTITNLRYKAESFKQAAEHALRMSESLPIDPDISDVD
jgi:hypothetical protein